MNGPNNPIQWCDYTWNPVSGCKHGCSYCYARRIAKRLEGTKAFPHGFAPQFHPERLSQPSKVSGARIFISSMGDLLGSWVPSEWIHKTIEAITNNKQNTFQVLTKNPQRLSDFSWPKNAWIGTTITGIEHDLSDRLSIIGGIDHATRFLSVEPLFADVDVSYAHPDWIIIGQQTGPGAKPINSAWVDSLDTVPCPVFHKDNLICRKGHRRMEFPRS